MNPKIEYHYLTRHGALKGFKKSNPSKEMKTLLVLDSSVCLDIVNVVNKKQINKDSKRKVFELIEYSQKKSMQPFEYLALLELSLDKVTYKLDTDKFQDIKNKVSFAFQLPLERLKKNNFDYSTDHFPANKPHLNNDASAFAEQILLHYSALLKIREIACKGLGKQKAKENIIEFLDWMDIELGIILGLEYQLAFQIFGGNNSFNTMIKENSNKERVLKTLWGSSWDLLHARVGRNYQQLSEIVNEDINSIFITNDKRLFELLSPQVEFSSGFGKSRITVTDGDENCPPYFNTEFVNELNKKILDIFEKRDLSNSEYPDSNLIRNIIIKMEKNIY